MKYLSKAFYVGMTIVGSIIDVVEWIYDLILRLQFLEWMRKEFRLFGGGG